jgi:hypothetical protein
MKETSQPQTRSETSAWSARITKDQDEEFSPLSRLNFRDIAPTKAACPLTTNSIEKVILRPASEDSISSFLCLAPNLATGEYDDNGGDQITSVGLPAVSFP